MSAQLRLLDSDKVTPFVSQSFGNILTDTVGVPKLVFMDSYGDAVCNSSEFGIEAISGNDGNTFCELSEGADMDASGVTVAGTVVTTGGSIDSSLSIEYKVTVMDRWGNESEVNPSSYSPSFSSGSTNKVDLTWTAVAEVFKYVVYSNIASAGWFKVAEATTEAYTDLDGTNDGATTPPASGAVAYKFATWGASAIAAGNLAAGAKKSVGFRENIPSTATAVGNPRQHKIYVSFLTT